MAGADTGRSPPPGPGGTPATRTRPRRRPTEMIDSMRQAGHDRVRPGRPLPGRGRRLLRARRAPDRRRAGAGRRRQRAGAAASSSPAGPSFDAMAEWVATRGTTASGPLTPPPAAATAGPGRRTRSWPAWSPARATPRAHRGAPARHLHHRRPLRHLPGDRGPQPTSAATTPPSNSRPSSHAGWPRSPPTASPTTAARPARSRAPTWPASPAPRSAARRPPPRVGLVQEDAHYRARRPRPRRERRHRRQPREETVTGGNPGGGAAAAAAPAAAGSRSRRGAAAVGGRPVPVSGVPAGTGSSDEAALPPGR